MTQTVGLNIMESHNHVTLASDSPNFVVVRAPSPILAQVRYLIKVVYLLHLATFSRPSGACGIKFLWGFS